MPALPLWVVDLRMQLDQVAKRVALEQQRGDLLQAQCELLRAREQKRTDRWSNVPFALASPAGVGPATPLRVSCCDAAVQACIPGEQQADAAAGPSSGSPGPPQEPPPQAERPPLQAATRKQREEVSTCLSCWSQAGGRWWPGQKVPLSESSSCSGEGGGAAPSRRQAVASAPQGGAAQATLAAHVKCRVETEEPIEVLEADTTLAARLAAVEALRSEAEQRASSLERQVLALEASQQLRRGVQELEAELAKSREASNKKDTELDMARENASRLQGELVAAKAELERLAAARAELERYQEVAHHQEQELQQLRAEAAAAVAAAVAAAQAAPAEAGHRRSAVSRRASADLAATIVDAAAASGRRCSTEAGQNRAAGATVEALVAGLASDDAVAVRAALEGDPTDGGLLEAEVDPATGGRAMHFAARSGSAKAALQLLECVQRRSAKQRHWLDLELELLLRREKRILDGPDLSGRSPLAELLRQPSPNEEVTVKLMAAKADPSRRDNYGMTPGLECAGRGHLRLLQVLLQATRGALLFEANDAGHTALHCAAAAGHGPVVELLLRNKADPSAADVQGRTPADAAEAAGHAGLAELLWRAGPRPQGTAPAGRPQDVPAPVGIAAAAGAAGAQDGSETAEDAAKCNDVEHGSVGIVTTANSESGVEVVAASEEELRD